MLEVVVTGFRAYPLSVALVTVNVHPPPAVLARVAEDVVDTVPKVLPDVAVFRLLTL